MRTQPPKDGVIYRIAITVKPKPALLRRQNCDQRKALTLCDRLNSRQSDAQFCVFPVKA